MTDHDAVDMHQVSRVLEALDAVLDDTAQQMASLIREQFLEYRTFPSEDAEEEWRAGLRWALGLFVSLQRRPDPTLTADEVRFIESIGSLRADQEIAWTAVLGSVRVATYAAVHVVRRIAQEVAGDDAMTVVDWIHFQMTCFVNEFSDAISRGYVIRTEELVTERERVRAQFYMDLLTGAFSTFHEVEKRAGPVRAEVAHRVGLVLVPSHNRGGAAFVAEVRTAFRKATIVPMASAVSPHAAVLLPVDTEGSWQAATKSMSRLAAQCQVVVFTVGICDVPIELHERYAEASPLLAVAPARSYDGWLLPIEWLVPHYVTFILPSFITSAVERRVLEPLRSHARSTKLLDTLDAVFRAGLSPKSSGALLGVSDSTARARRYDLESTAKLAFDQPADVVWFGLAWGLEERRKHYPP